MRRFSLCLLLAIFALLFGGARAASAHSLQVEPVVVAVRAQTSYLDVHLRGNGEDIIQAVKVRDSERVGLDNTEFVPAVHRRLQDYLNTHLQLSQGGQRLRGEITNLEYWRPDRLDYTTSKFDLTLHYPRDPKVAQAPFRVTTRLFDYLPNARTILSVGGVQKGMTPGQTQEFDPQAVTANLLGNVRDFAVWGAEHIFTGPDHILFILALMLVSTSFKSLVKTLSGFTLAHSITLVLTTLGVVSPPAKLVDVVVALSIVYVGLENVFGKGFGHRFWVASAFGLIHGFAFAGNLREIGLPDEGVGWCLLSFNLGVEIGQVIICALAYPLMARLRFKMQENARLGGSSDWARAARMASWLVVAAGSFWLVQRVLA
ncbi:MAG TPA: HupE/UreJ family protein [Abditibacterium sp.]|jgi:hydrogenase/urease accessory protein HupE